MISLGIWVGLASAADVTLWHTYRGNEELAIQQSVDAFSAEHEDLTVDVVAIPFGAYDGKLETAIPHGNGPDLFIAAHGSSFRWARMGIISPVQIEDTEAFLPVALDAFHDDEAQWAYPLSLKSPLLLYNPNLVSEVPKTTAELFVMAKEASKDEVYGLAYENSAAYYHSSWMHGFGGRAFDENGRATLDTPEQVEALRFAKALSDAELVPPSPTAYKVGQLYDNGHAAFVIGGPWFMVDRLQPISAAQMPIVSETSLQASPYLTVEGVFFSTEHHPRSVELATYLATGDGAQIRQEVGAQVLGLAGQEYLDDSRRAMAEQAEKAIPLPTNPHANVFYEAQSRALRRVLRGTATPEDAAKEAQSYFSKLAKEKPEPTEVKFYLFALAGILVAAAGYLGFQVRQNRRGISMMRHAYRWVLPAALSVALLVVVPFLTGAFVSFYSHVDGDWTFVGMSNYRQILHSQDWPISSPMSFFYTLGVTVLWTVSNVFLHVLLGVSLALMLREPWVRLKPMWRALLILPWAIPNYITALVWKSMFDFQYGAVNKILGFAFFQDGPLKLDWFASFSTAFCANLATNTWLGFPFMMIVSLGALQAIPRELEDAARVDGASYLHRLRHVVWPMLKPALLPAIILGSIWTFNMFNVVFLVSGGEPDGSTEILISQAYRWAFTRGNLYGYASAYAVIIFGALFLYSKFANAVVGRRVL